MSEKMAKEHVQRMNTLELRAQQVPSLIASGCNLQVAETQQQKADSIWIALADHVAVWLDHETMRSRPEVD
jgi:hypothetical protein